jgi:hypothetical protein
VLCWYLSYNSLLVLRLIFCPCMVIKTGSSQWLGWATSPRTVMSSASCLLLSWISSTWEFPFYLLKTNIRKCCHSLSSIYKLILAYEFSCDLVCCLIRTRIPIDSSTHSNLVFIHIMPLKLLFIGLPVVFILPKPETDYFLSSYSVF